MQINQIEWDRLRDADFLLKKIEESNIIRMHKSHGNLMAVGSENISFIPEGYVDCYVVPTRDLPNSTASGWSLSSEPDIPETMKDLSGVTWPTEDDEDCPPPGAWIVTSYNEHDQPEAVFPDELGARRYADMEGQFMNVAFMPYGVPYHKRWKNGIEPVGEDT